jgi:hypothetical protein
MCNDYKCFENHILFNYKESFPRIIDLQDIIIILCNNFEYFEHVLPYHSSAKLEWYSSRW